MQIGKALFDELSDAVTNDRVWNQALLRPVNFFGGGAVHSFIPQFCWRHVDVQQLYIKTDKVKYA